MVAASSIPHSAGQPPPDADPFNLRDPFADLLPWSDVCTAVLRHEDEEADAEDAWQAASDAYDARLAAGIAAGLSEAEAAAVAEAEAGARIDAAEVRREVVEKARPRCPTLIRLEVEMVAAEVAATLPAPPVWRDRLSPDDDSLAIVNWRAWLPPIAQAIASRVPDACQLGAERTKDHAWVAIRAEKAKRAAREAAARLEAAGVRTHAERERDHATPPDYLIDGVLPRPGVMVVCGAPGDGKSLMLGELTRCVPMAAPFGGRATMVTHDGKPPQGGAVLYVCPDSPGSTERRMLALPAEARGRVFTLAECPLLPAGAESIDAMLADMQAAGMAPALVVFDTYDACRAHGDGGYQQADGLTEAILGKLRRIAAKYRVGIVIVHHVPHAKRGEAKRPRGSATLTAKLEAWGWIDRDGDLLRLRLGKNRDGDLAAAFTPWRIVPVDVGGRPVPTLADAPDAAHAFAAIDKAAEQAAKDRPVLAYLARAAREGLPTTQAAIGEAAGINPNSIRRVLARLERDGLIGEDRRTPTPEGLADLAAADADKGFEEDNSGPDEGAT